MYDKSAKRYGFRTDLRTRPQIIDYLKLVVRENIEVINDEDTLNEMLEFVYNDQGRPEAQEGSHDDLVMSLAISYRILEQVREKEPVIASVEKSFFSKGTRNYTARGSGRGKGRVSVV